ncbi:MAG: class I SAM-dependent methyltransferase [Betaproteobacteria bacterium]
MIPEDVGRYYPADYYSYDLRRHHPWKRRRRGLRRRWILTAPSSISSALGLFSQSDELFHLYRNLGVKPGCRLLDVGAGSGGHVLELRDAGVAEAIGLDPFLRQDVIVDGKPLVYRRSLEEMTGAFDLITFHHSLEHMPQQIEALTEARRLLASGGRVLVRVPTVTSEAFERYQEDWVSLDAPRHFFLHSHRSLEIAASKAGLEISRLWCDSTAIQFMASEQYQRGIPLTDPRSSAFGTQGGLFTRAQRRHFEHKTRAVNRALRGDAVCALLSVSRNEGKKTN